MNDHDYKENGEDIVAVVLAAGKGTRMHSDTPKVLHPLLGEPMLWYVLQAVGAVVQDRSWTVVGHQAEQVQGLFPDQRFVIQKEQLGTGHALQCAWPMVRGQARWCLVVNGDVPLMDARAVRRFCETTIQDQADLGFMTLRLADPQAYGRVVRDAHGRITGIVEARDHDPSRHGVYSGEVNAGVYLLRVESMEQLLFRISADNQQQERYLTELVELAASKGLRVAATGTGEAGDAEAFMGVNSPAELVSSEETLRKRIVAEWLRRGVTVRSPDQARIGPCVVLEPGAEVSGPCELYGNSVVRAGAVVESHTWIKESLIASGCVVRAFSHLEGAELAERCMVGPFARLRPGTLLESEARVGNFVEIKKARLGVKSKANHLSYIGDAEVGSGVNIGAGTITCNYDGRKKHQTVIGNEAFIGSNSALVAPVRIGENALVGAGSVITRDVPDDVLAVARGRQQCFPKRNG